MQTIDSNSTSSEICLPDFSLGRLVLHATACRGDPAAGPAAAAFNWLLSVDAAAGLAARGASGRAPLSSSPRKGDSCGTSTSTMQTKGLRLLQWRRLVQTLTTAPLALGGVIPEHYRHGFSDRSCLM